jgi:hypothetical protein
LTAPKAQTVYERESLKSRGCIAAVSRRSREVSMRRMLLLSAMSCLAVSPAWSSELKPCDEAGVGLASILAPVAQNSVMLYEGKVTAYNIDTIEPACCAGGIAVVLPDVKDELGGSTCVALIGFGHIDVTKAKRSYDKTKGLLLELQTQKIGEGGGLVPDKALKLRINLGTSGVSIEP